VAINYGVSSNFVTTANLFNIVAELFCLQVLDNSIMTLPERDDEQKYWMALFEKI
jgi:hypothetical protein